MSLFTCVAYQGDNWHMYKTWCLRNLKVPCHAFPVITRPLVCYVAFDACKRSAESQTLKVHPVASKTLTQKRPVYAAPECLVGNFSFSIVFFL